MKHIDERLRHEVAYLTMLNLMQRDWAGLLAGVSADASFDLYQGIRAAIDCYILHKKEPEPSAN